MVLGLGGDLVDVDAREAFDVGQQVLLVLDILDQLLPALTRQLPAVSAAAHVDSRHVPGRSHAHPRLFGLELDLETRTQHQTRIANQQAGDRARAAIAIACSHACLNVVTRAVTERRYVTAQAQGAAEDD